MKPLKWQCDWDHSYYFENQRDSNLWFEYGKDQKVNKYKQVSVDADAKGGLVVILKRSSDSFSLKLNEEMVCYWNENQKCSDMPHFTGYWVKKHGK